MGMGNIDISPALDKDGKLDEVYLARHFIECKGKCQMNGKYCRHNRCPLSGQCLGMDKLNWALGIILGGDGGDDSSAGRCEDIW